MSQALAPDPRPPQMNMICRSEQAKRPSHPTRTPAPALAGAVLPTPGMYSGAQMLEILRHIKIL
jgi:hypothetical protein